MFETECQEEIAHAKSLGFYCTTMWNILSLIFGGKDNFERELSSENMFFSNNWYLHGKKSEFVECQELYISHRKDYAQGSFLDTEPHQIFGNGKDVQVFVWGLPRLEKRKKEQSYNCGYEEQYFLHLITTMVTTLITITVNIGLGITLYLLALRAILLSLLSLIQYIFLRL